MHSLGTAVHLALYVLNVRVPDRIASSMRMAYIVTKMNALAANITLSHLDTSSTYPFCKIPGNMPATLIYYQKYAEKASGKKSFFLFLLLLFPFSGKDGKI